MTRPPEDKFYIQNQLLLKKGPPIPDELKYEKACEFIELCLKPDLEARPSAKDLLNHPYPRVRTGKQKTNMSKRIFFRFFFLSLFQINPEKEMLYFLYIQNLIIYFYARILSVLNDNFILNKKENICRENLSDTIYVV